MDLETLRKRHRKYAVAIEKAGGMSRAVAPDIIIGCAATGNFDGALEIARQVHPHHQFNHPLAAAPVGSLATYEPRVISPGFSVKTRATTRWSRSDEYETAPTTILELEAEWVPGWDFVIADGCVLNGSGYFQLSMPVATRPHYYSRALNWVAYERPAEMMEIDEEVLFLSAPINGHVGHWMLDFLPRLIGGAGSGLRVAVPANLTQKHFDMLDAFGYDHARRILCDPRHVYHFKKLWVFSPGKYYPPNPKHVEFVRRGFFDAGQPMPGKRLFLSRGKVNTRLISNAEEFDRFLNEKSFEIVDMELLSFQAQKDLLRDAEVLLGPFGSNLLALYSAPPGCTIISLLDDPEMDPTLAQTSYFLGMKHQDFVCSSSGSSVAPLVTKKDVDYFVNIEELDKRLSAIDEAV